MVTISKILMGNRFPTAPCCGHFNTHELGLLTYERDVKNDSIGLRAECS